MYLTSGCATPLRGEVEIVATRGEERVVLVHENLVVNNLYTQLAYLLGQDVSSRNIDRIAFGTGTAAAVATNTTITHLSPAVWLTATVTYPTSYSVRFTASWSAAESNTANITEAGLYFAGSTGLAARVVYGPMRKSVGWTWTIQWTLAYSV